MWEGWNYCGACEAKAISWAIITCIQDCYSAITSRCSSIKAWILGSMDFGVEVVFSSEEEEAIWVRLLEPEDEVLWGVIGDAEMIEFGMGVSDDVRDNWKVSSLAIRVSKSDIAFCIPVSMLRILSSFAFVSSFFEGLWTESFTEETFGLGSLFFPLVTLE